MENVPKLPSPGEISGTSKPQIRTTGVFLKKLHIKTPEFQLDVQSLRRKKQELLSRDKMIFESQNISSGHKELEKP